MRKIFYFFIFLGLVVFSEDLAGAPPVGGSSSQNSAGPRMIYKFSSRELAGSFLTPQNIVISRWIVKDLMNFEKEVHDSYLLRSADFEFVFSGEGNAFPFRNFKIRAFRISEDGQETFSRSYQIDEVRTGGAALAYMRLKSLDDPALLQAVFDIYNFRYDADGNILDRAILKMTKDSSFDLDGPFLKFQEGIWIEYRDYQQNFQPSSLALKTFILSKDGSKIWLETRESQKRRFNEQGFMTQETTRITTYSYSGLSGESYAIYNVRLDPSGELSAYDIVFPKLMDVPFSEQENLEIQFGRNEKGELLEKIVRKYTIEDRLKKYLKGVLQSFTLENSKVAKMEELSFDIRPGMSGAFKEERIPRQAIYIWNLAFNEKGDILARRVLQTSFSYPTINGAEEKMELLESYKNIALSRDLKTGFLKELSVDYFDFQPDRSFVPVRKVRIEILELMPTGDPSKIRLVVQSPFDSSAGDEQVIIQDCNYIINEAVVGKLFDQKQERSFDVDLEEVSSEGEIRKVVFYGYRMEGESKKYIRQEEFTLGEELSSVNLLE